MSEPTTTPVATPSETPATPVDTQEAPSQPSQEPVEAKAESNPTEPTEAAEAPKEERPSELSLDQLLDMHLEGKEFEAEKHKGVDYKATIEALPEDAKRLIQNLRADYSRKTDAISKQKKALETREQTLLSSKTEEHLRKAMELPENIDIYDPEGLKQYINAKAAEQLQTLLKPAREKMAADQRRAEVDNFRKQHTDMDNYKDGIRKLIIEKNMKIEDAYFLLKGKESKSEKQRLNEELEAYKKAARETGFKVSTGRNTVTAKPKFATAYEAYEWRKKQMKS